MTTKGVILEQAPPSATHIDPKGGGANPPLMPETEPEQSMWQKSSPWVHGVLGVASFVPGLSVVTGALDAAIYTAEGEFVEAGLAAASMIPGGKVVTTVGKVAKGAAGIAKGTGTAARVVKGAHEAEEVLKAARKAEEAARIAKEAKAAKEAREAKEAADKAREAASSARKPKKEVTIKTREHKVPCFHPFDKKKFMRMSQSDQKAYLKEMAKQLKQQEDAINSLTASQYKDARDAFKAVNRNPVADMAQAEVRNQATANIRMNIIKSLRKKGMSAADAKKEGIIRTEAVMGKLAALHDPDMVAGGWMRAKTLGIGRADVNSSIGASWNQNNRVSGMDSEAKRAIEDGRGDQKMNVKLEPCRGRIMR